MGWPSYDGWKALADGERFDRRGKLIALNVVDCGELVANHGRLVVCDPYTGLEADGNPIISIPPGRYPVKVTIADVSGAADGSHLRHAYATLLLSGAAETTRRVLTPLQDGDTEPELEDEQFVGFGVDAGTACFIDEGALATGMPDPVDWSDEVFENDDDACWFSRMDDPDHIGEDLANVPLPLATDGSNAILMSSGWGDGVYPVVGGYDADGNLVRVHIDFLVIGPPDDEDESAAESSAV
jgi:hypothetical protein